MKKFIIDTIFGITFWFIIMMTYEVIFCDMTFKQSFITRCGAIVINFLTSGLNALFTDWYRKRIGADKKANFFRYLFDAFGVIIFQLPVYIIILLCSHSIQLLMSGNWNIDNFIKEIIWAFTFFPLLLFCVGWIYGICLDKTRKLFRINPC